MRKSHPLAVHHCTNCADAEACAISRLVVSRRGVAKRGNEKWISINPRSRSVLNRRPPIEHVGRAFHVFRPDARNRGAMRWTTRVEGRRFTRGARRFFSLAPAPIDVTVRASARRTIRRPRAWRSPAPPPSWTAACAAAGHAVVYVDTESTFRGKRLWQIAEARGAAGTARRRGAGGRGIAVAGGRRGRDASAAQTLGAAGVRPKDKLMVVVMKGATRFSKARK